MPRLNETGPQGLGPRTGRGLGLCGYGRGNGFGRCMSCGNSMYLSPKNQLQSMLDEEQVLKEELDALKNEIEAIKKAQ